MIRKHREFGYSQNWRAKSGLFSQVMFVLVNSKTGGLVKDLSSAKSAFAAILQLFNLDWPQ